MKKRHIRTIITSFLCVAVEAYDQYGEDVGAAWDLVEE